MRKFASVREGGSHNSPLTRSASVQATYPRHESRIGAQGSISSLLYEDVGALGGLQKTMEEPVEHEASWRDRLWLLGSRRKPEKWAEGLTPARETILEEDESQNKVPKWKQFLNKFKKEARKMAKRQNKGSQDHRQGSAFGKEKQQEEKLRGPIVFPEPLPVRISERRETPVTPIWQRRQVGQPSALDLRKVRDRNTKHNKKR